VTSRYVSAAARTLVISISQSRSAWGSIEHHRRLDPDGVTTINDPRETAERHEQAIRGQTAGS